MYINEKSEILQKIQKITRKAVKRKNNFKN